MIPEGTSPEMALWWCLQLARYALGRVDARAWGHLTAGIVQLEAVQRLTDKPRPEEAKA